MTTLGKYELHEQLGRGGFGTVYRATDTTLGREVALKILHPQLTTDPDFLERFRNEGRLVASLRSPHIVTIHELGEVDGRVFIAMEYLAGGSLKQRLESGPIPYPETVEIMRQLCDGLSVAHAKGLVHRDIKPGNILFDIDGRAVIADFGLARAMQVSSSSASSSTGGVGTPAYRAPELWRGKPPASPATDIYSLGCVLSEMLTGKTLFDGSTPDEIITQHLVDGPQIPASYPGCVPEKLHGFIAHALNKDPQQRTANTTAFMQGLEGLRSQPETPLVEVPKSSQTARLTRVEVIQKTEPVQRTPSPSPQSAEIPSIAALSPDKPTSVILPFALVGLALLILVIGLTTDWLGLATAPTAAPTEQPTAALISSSATPGTVNMEQPTATSNLAAQAIVDIVKGKGANVVENSPINSGDLITTDVGIVGVKVQVKNQPDGFIYLFRRSSARIIFTDTMDLQLKKGAIYIQPGSSIAYVDLSYKVGGLRASVTGSRMIVEIRENDIRIYCFEGNCQLEPQGVSPILVDAGYKIVYYIASSKADDPVEMSYNEQWDWNELCLRLCLSDKLATPTSLPLPPN